jgi:hypothetical protein
MDCCVPLILLGMSLGKVSSGSDFKRIRGEPTSFMEEGGLRKGLFWMTFCERTRCKPPSEDRFLTKYWLRNWGGGASPESWD